MVACSLAFFAAGIWPMVSLVVGKSELGTAFGMFVAIQNTGNTVGSAIISVMQPPRCDNQYICCDGILAGLAGVSALAAVLIRVKGRDADKSKGAVDETTRLLGSGVTTPDPNTFSPSDFESVQRSDAGDEAADVLGDLHPIDNTYRALPTGRVPVHTDTNPIDMAVATPDRRKESTSHVGSLNSQRTLSGDRPHPRGRLGSRVSVGLGNGFFPVAGDDL